jgi:hypothetical protein
MSVRTTIMVLLACAMSPVAHAEDCRQYPHGPERFACASRKHPELLERREQCRQQGLQMGLRNKGQGGTLRNFVQACMHRR